MIRWVSIFAILFVVSSSNAAFSQDQSKMTVLFNAIADPDACNSDTSRQVSAGTLFKDAGAFGGECITVTAPFSPFALYLRRNDAFVGCAAWDDACRERRIGLYFNENSPLETASTGRIMTITGLVRDCETLRAVSHMVMGYCHYTSGPVLLVSEAHRSGKTWWVDKAYGPRRR